MFEQLLEEFNDYVTNSGRPEWVLSAKDFVDYYDFCAIDGVENSANYYMSEMHSDMCENKSRY
jgi:hypothetical protein